MGPAQAPRPASSKPATRKPFRQKTASIGSTAPPKSLPQGPGAVKRAQKAPAQEAWPEGAVLIP
ncbi:hypothetical protein TJA_09910 [Thermus sp. LT1-2-5]